MLDDMLPAEAENVEGLAAALVLVKLLRRDLAVVQDRIEGYLVNAMPERQVTVEGIGTLVRRPGTKRKKWDGTLLIGEVLKRAIVDPETGEVDVSPSSIHAFAATLMACAGLDNASHSWRAGELRKLDINPDDYCEKETGRSTIQLSGSSR